MSEPEEFAERVDRAIDMGADYERVGRLIVDGDLNGSEVSDLTKAINLQTKFTARRSTPMRVDVFRESRNDTFEEVSE